MWRRVGIVVALAAAIIALAAWFATRDRHDAVPAISARPARGAPAAPPSRPPGGAGAAAASPAEPDDPGPVIEATHGAVHAIGRRCWTSRTPLVVPRGQPDDTIGRMELRLRVEIAGGQARVSERAVVSTRRLTDELRDCIVAGVGAASWPVAAPDGTVTIVELFRMGDYLGPDPSQPPPPMPSRPPPR